MNMPTYWRNKIYSEEEREELWIEKLNKEIRYVGGEEVSVKDGEEKYEELREYYRNKNMRLGYGDGSIDWNRRNYENAIRNMNFIKRIEAAKNKEDAEKIIKKKGLS